LKPFIPPPIVALLCGLGIYFTRQYFPFTLGAYTSHLGSLFLVSGILMLFFAAASFRKHKTTINPLKPDAASYLVTSGVFKISRNPMYLGMLLILMGIAVYFNPIGGCLICFIFWRFITNFQILPEEAAMQKLFTKEFSLYSNKTRRWL
jgi:protein-S-isoprenylcysteine O-methyltransferase Ste14